MIRVAFVTSPEDIAACLALRRAVFIIEQRVSEAEEIDGADPECLHVLARDRCDPIGAARVRIIGETAKIQRVCVAREHRMAGVGAALMQTIIARLRTMPEVATVRLGAQISALGFYQRLGFIAEGPKYQDAGLMHRDMTLSLRPEAPRFRADSGS